MFEEVAAGWAMHIPRSQIAAGPEYKLSNHNLDYDSQYRNHRYSVPVYFGPLGLGYASQARVALPWTLFGTAGMASASPSRSESIAN